VCSGALYGIVDCGHMQKPICNSDHVGIKMVFRTGKLKQPIRQQRSLRQTLAQHDHAELETVEGRKAFNDKYNASTAETIANGAPVLRRYTPPAQKQRNPTAQDQRSQRQLVQHV
jgi:hypothetical protein